MKNRPIASKLFIILILMLCVFSVILVQGCSEESPAEQAKSILEKSGLRGGLIVHVNCGNGVLTEALKANESFLVQGLDPKIQNVRKAREYISSRQKYGPISIDQLIGKYLPYKDNLVNMIVAEHLGGISKDEAMRVLTPNGVLLTQGFFGWKKTVKEKLRRAK